MNYLSKTITVVMAVLASLIINAVDFSEKDVSFNGEEVHNV